MERLTDKPLIQCLAVTGNHSSSKTDPDREIRVNISHRVFIRPPTSIRLFIVALLFLASTLAGLAQNGAQKPAKTVID